MYLVVGGVYFVVWAVVQMLRDATAPEFPVWFRLLGPVLPLLVLPRCSGRMRIGMMALALVGVVTLNASTLGVATVAPPLTAFGSCVMVWAGWTGRSSAERLKELKELLPWIAAFGLFYLALSVGRLVVSN